MSSTSDEPRLVSFLVDRGLHEQDPVRRSELDDLVRQWRALGPGEYAADTIWNAMVELSHTYMHATGYEKRWSR